MTPHAPNAVVEPRPKTDSVEVAGAPDGDVVRAEMVDLHECRSLLKEAIAAHRTAVVELEWLAERANRAADIAREKLTTLELKCEDWPAFIPNETISYLEPIQSQNPNPALLEGQASSE